MTVIDGGGEWRDAIRASGAVPPSDLAGFVHDHASLCGATSAVVYLADFSGRYLVPVPGPPSAADLVPVAIDGSLAGRAYVLGEPVISHGGAEPTRIWTPLLDGAFKLGVLQTRYEEEPGGPDVFDACEDLAVLVTMLVVSKGRYGDLFSFVRRSRRMSVPAEMQWALLPPTNITAPQVSICGMVEPAHTVAGDAYDYALNGPTAHFAIFDAMGHGLRSATLAGTAVGAYRNARRSMLSLDETVLHLEGVLNELPGEGFVTALLLELDTEQGELRWTSAGHPSPLHLRNGRLVGVLDIEPEPPLGVSLVRSPTLGVRVLEPGDAVLAFSDGIIESRRRDGGFFTVDRLVDFVTRASLSGQGTVETLRRLTQSILEYQDGILQDDATVLMATWPGRPDDSG